MQKEKRSYREASDRLEEIVRHIEHGNPDVDELTALVKEAVELAQYCKDKLTKADAELDKLMTQLKGEQ